MGAEAGAGAGLQSTLVAGRLAEGARAAGGGGGSGDGARGAGGAGGGSGGVRHQAAVAEVRRHLGGGGKRGWVA